jgi:hypothetical protein
MFALKLFGVKLVSLLVKLVIFERDEFKLMLRLFIECK